MADERKLIDDLTEAVKRVIRPQPSPPSPPKPQPPPPPSPGRR